MIMQNMIIENERGKDLDYTSFDLTRQPVRPRRRKDRIRRFLEMYHDIRDSDKHENLQKKISLSSGGHGMANKTTSFIFMFDVVCDELCVLFDSFGIDFYANN